MKFLNLFGKTPSNKKFNFTPRFYNPEEAERQERESRIRRELKEKDEADKLPEENFHYRQRIAGSFRTAKKTATVQSDPSTNVLRLVIMLILAVGLIGFLQWGMPAIYGLSLVFFPIYFFSKFRKLRRKD